MSPVGPLVNFPMGRLGLNEGGVWAIFIGTIPPSCPSLTKEQDCTGIEGCNLLLESGWNICKEINTP